MSDFEQYRIPVGAELSESGNESTTDGRVDARSQSASTLEAPELLPGAEARAERSAGVTVPASKPPSQPREEPATAGGAQGARAQTTVRGSRVRVRTGSHRLSAAPPAPTEAMPQAVRALAARGARFSVRPPPEPPHSPGVPRRMVVGLWVIAVALGLFLIQRARVRSGGEQASEPVVVVEPGAQ